ncbi:MAG: DUF4190 domain-containing protein [Phycisphaerales bacterium]|nr:DUF4190 domain-containing protein [Phycisphaerales bacterium]
MAMTIQCPSCHQMISVEVPAGTQVQCPLCNQVVTVPGTGMPAVEMPTTMQYSPRPQHQPEQGTAVGALVCGILGLVACPLVGIAGIIMGARALKKIRSDPARYGGRGLAHAGIWTGVASIAWMVILVPLIIGISLPAFTQARGMAEQMACMANLQIIGSSLQIYASSDGNKAFPDDINKLIASGEIAAQQLVCPSDNLRQNSYYYVPGYTLESDHAQILMYEDPAIHSGGGHILYVDGQVHFVNSPKFQEQIDAVTLPDGTPYAPHKN